jgi:DNA (cytosine-5)-methyltransferase 1
MARIIQEVRPRFVFVENSPLLVRRGLARVLSDLASMGFDARWGIVGAVDVGAPHIRERIWILANARHMCRRGWSEPNQEIKSTIGNGGQICNTERTRLERTDVVGRTCNGACQQEQVAAASASIVGTVSRLDWWESESGLGRVADGVANRVDRLKAIGNGQVPAVAALAWRLLAQTE